MIRAKNYETVFKFVKVMRIILWLCPLFFRTQCIIAVNGIRYVYIYSGTSHWLYCCNLLVLCTLFHSSSVVDEYVDGLVLLLLMKLFVFMPSDVYVRLIEGFSAGIC